MFDIGSNSLSGGITLGSDGVSVGVNSSTDHLTLTGGISDGGSGFSFAKVGQGDITFSSTNTYTGATYVNAGTIILNNNTALGTALTHTSSVTVASGGTLQINIINSTPVIPLSIAGVGFSNSGALSTLGGVGNSVWNGAITLTADATITSNNPFTINGTIDGTYNLTLNGSAALTLSNPLGSLTQLASVSASNPLIINGQSIKTSGTQTYIDTVTIASSQTTTLTTTGNSAVVFNTTVNSASLTPGDLSIVTGGTGAISLDGNVGAGFPLGNITLNSAGTSTIGGTVHASSLTFVTNATANTIINGASITTTGGVGQIYNNNVSLGGSTTLLSGSAPITFNGTLNGLGLGQVLTVQNAAATGAVTFNRNVSLDGLTTTAGAYAVSLYGLVTNIFNAMTFTNTAGVNLGNGGGDTLTFAAGLTSTASTTTLNGVVNSTNTLATLGTTVLAGNSTVNSGTNAIDLTGTVTGGFSLAVVSGIGTTFSNTVNIGSLDASGGGTDIINTGTMTTTGTQDYHDALTLGANVLFTTTGSTLTFGGTVNGAHNLTAATGAGNVIFSGASVGLTTALLNLSSTGSGTVTFDGSVGNNTHLLTTVSITGNTNINGGSVFTSGLQTYTGGVTLGAATQLNSGTDVIMSSSLNGGGNTLTLTNTGANSAIVGSISNLAGLTKSGAGTLTLSGSNTYTGTTLLSAGILVINNTNALGSAVSFSSGVTVTNGTTISINGVNVIAPSPLTLNGTGTSSNGALVSNGTSGYVGNVILNTNSTISDTGTLTLSGIVSGAALTKIGAGTLVLSNAGNSYGATNINVGTLQLGGNNAVPATSDVTVALGSTFDLNNFNDTIGSLAGAGNTLIGTGTLTTGDANSTNFSGVMSQSGNLIVEGTGVFTLSGSNTYTGTTTVNSGTLSIANNNGLGSGANFTSSVTVANTGTLQLTGVTIAPNIPMALNGLLTETGTSSYAGIVTVAVGSSINPTGTLTLNNKVSGTVLTVNGSGTLVLTSNGDNYSGATDINSGILKLAVTNAVPMSNVVMLIGSTFNLNGFSDSILSLAGNGSVTLGGGGTLTVNNTTNTIFNGVISLAGNLIKNGANNFTLVGANTYIGATTINNGTLIASNASALGGATTVATVNSGGLLDLTVSGVIEPVTLNNSTLESTGVASLNGNVTLNSATTDTIMSNAGSVFTMVGTINGAAALNLTGAGTLTLTGNIGNTTRVTSINDTNSSTTINTSQILSTGSQTYSDPIIMGANATVGSSSSSILFSSTVDGGFALNVLGGTTVTFNGVVGATPLAALGVTAANIAINSGAISTTGSQGFSGAVNLGADTTFTSGTANIVFDTSIAGGHNLFLIGGVTGSHDFVLPATLTVNNVTVTANVGSTNNALTVPTNGTQNWLVSGADTGSLTGATGVSGTFGFTNVGNLTGGAGADNFTLNGGTLSGAINGSGGSNTLLADNGVANTFNITGVNAGSATGAAGFANIQSLVGGSGDNNTFNFFSGGSVSVINGGSLANTNILDFSSVPTPVTVVLSSTFTGSAPGATYININQLNGNYVNDEITTSPTATVVMTGVKQGFINHPLFFFGFDVNQAAPPVPPTPPPVPPSPPYIDISGIIQQPIINHEPSQEPILPGSGNWSYDPGTTDNLADIVATFQVQYNNDVNHIGIDPVCYSLSGV